MASKYNVGREDIDQWIIELAKKFSLPENIEFTRQILTTVVKLYFDGASQADLKLINISLKELRHALRMFAPYRDKRKVTLWGSSRLHEKDPEYKLAEKFAEQISKKGFMVITGGGGGVMEAGNRGAKGKGFGINIQLPAEQMPNPYVKDEMLMKFHYFFTRKLIFVKESDATVLFPGGFGTNDEAFEILTLTQTGKTTPRPIVMVETKGGTYWKRWLKFVEDEMEKKGFIPKDDFLLFKIANTVDDAVKEIVNYYRVYDSIRFVGHSTVIRLNKRLSESDVRVLNKEFCDILSEGKIEDSKPLPEEVRDKDKLKLPRIVLCFNRRDYGRLSEMIRRINQF